jgi:hypothetical protein
MLSFDKEESICHMARHQFKVTLPSFDKEESISTMFCVFHGLTFSFKSVAYSPNMLLERLPAIEVLFSSGTFVILRV